MHFLWQKKNACYSLDYSNLAASLKDINFLPAHVCISLYIKPNSHWHEELLMCAQYLKGSPPENKIELDCIYSV